jgi:hypothetical protein
MGASRWPTVGELRERMAREPSALGAAADMLSDTLVEASVEWLEKTTNWDPFLATNGTHSYPPPLSRGRRGAVLDLGRGLLSATSLYWGDRLLCEGPDWSVAARVGDAATVLHIHAFSDIRHVARITISGRWGLMERPSSLAFEAVSLHAMSQAVAAFHAEYANVQAGGWREGDRSVNSPRGSGLDVGGALLERARQMAMKLQKVSVG